MKKLITVGLCSLFLAFAAHAQSTNGVPNNPPGLPLSGGTVTGPINMTCTGCTSGAFPDGAAFFTFQTPNSQYFAMAWYDGTGNVTRTFDQLTGRMDLYAYSTTSPLAGPAFVLAYSTPTPAIGDSLGHYAWREQDSNGNFDTYAFIVAYNQNPSAASLSSSMSLDVMRNVAAGSGNAQPNWGMTIDGNQGTVTMPTGAAISMSGNLTDTAATGPSMTFTNSTNSRNLVIGVTDNYDGVINATGGGNLVLEVAGTIGINMNSLHVFMTTLPVQIGLDYLVGKTSSYSLLQTDGGTVFNNNGASGNVTFTLPTAPTIGTLYSFYVQTAQALEVLAPAGVTINLGGSASSSGGNVTSSTIGSSGSNRQGIRIVGKGLDARLCDREGERNVTILMHRVIITERMGLARPSERHFVDHENGDSLDNRRENDHGLPQLRWLTPKENMANQRGIRSRPVVPAFRSALSDIPF